MASEYSPTWSKEAVEWQRTAYHFQPERNWMNDPNAPMFYKGWYHFFYQYNPESAVWGNMSWGHAVSRDLIHWLHLPLAMIQDKWYDAGGVFTGSATFIPDGSPVIVYTGLTEAEDQVQAIAHPADPSDPLLLQWVKSPSNPVLLAPPGFDPKNFRDPTTGWYDPADSSWLVAVGAMGGYHSGHTLVFRTKDFISYDLLPGSLHKLSEKGMWECVEFYPVLANGSADGVDDIVPAKIGPPVKHILKTGLFDYSVEYYVIGTYEPETGKWTPDDPAMDVGVGLRYDYAKAYAAKSFYDQEKRRRVLWLWIPEADSKAADMAKGWSGLQAVPRTVRLDEKTRGKNLVQWPVQEVESLRTTSMQIANIRIAAGQFVPLNVGGDGSQLDITVEFELPNEDGVVSTLEADKMSSDISSSGGAEHRGALGPFGLLVLADEDRVEQTAICFYVEKGAEGEPRVFVCNDTLRSSLASDVEKKVYGSTVPVLDGENLSLRVLVDHSIVETFAQGGRTCITTRSYPTKAINGDARVFLFNHAMVASVTAAHVEVWQMNSAHIQPYPLP